MKKLPTIRQPVLPHSGMYIFVFTSRLSFVVVILLLMSIILQPIEFVFAGETIPSSTEIEIISESISDDLETPGEINDDTGNDTFTDENEMPSAGERIEPAEQLMSSSTLEIAEEINSTTTVVADNQIVETGTEDVVSNTVSEENFPTEESEDTLSVASTASSSDVVGEIVTAVSYSDSVVQFDKDSCVRVSDGSFYCQSDIGDSSDRPDGVYSLPDKDGDLEIFIQAGGELTQVTFNTEDDSSPHFDGESNTLVWHRLIDDRYQIISYDVDLQQETQLTNDSVNNMEPTRSGNYTIWQHWDNNWEVMLFDGTTKRQLTHSVEHDVSPNIRNGLVVWYRLSEGNEKTIQLFNIKTGEFTTIKDSDGGTISNPRMVVVYETTYENGDVVTKGYDLITGEIISLDTAPVELPDQLPNPDATGETRALIQPKPITKEEGDSDMTTPTVEPPPPPESSAFDLVINSSTSSSQTSSTSVLIASSTLVTITDLTLDLSVPDVPSTGLQFTIEDVVVPPYSPEQTSVEVTTNSLEIQ